ncbi:MATE family efflux transporter [Hymenobacter rubidus]|uniref:MATE family efflux transporter n=1 Tax=Hymenobacter rubidus TaxID=1441626 RepID=UPI00191F78E4|nr:MATE family efflux transporter [Hymenobacter rubidus]
MSAPLRQRRPVPVPAPGATYRTLLRLAGPVLLGSLTQSALYLTDSLFVGQLGEAPLAAVGLGGLVFYLLSTVGAGLGQALQTLVARRLVQGRPGAARRLFTATGYLAGGGGLALAGALWLGAPWLSATLVPEPAVAAQLTQYLRVAALALPASFAWLALVGLYTGLGETRLLPWSAFALTVANVLGSHAWVSGGLGAPALGIAGAGWATLLSECTGTAVLLAGLLWPTRPALAGWLRKWAWHPRAVRRLGQFAVPLVARQVVEVSGWLLFFVLVGRLGTRALAVSNIVRSLYTFASLPALALAAALQTLVSRYAGQGRWTEVLPTVGRATALAVGLGLAPAGVLLLAPRLLVGCFSAEPTLVAAGAPVLQLLAGLLLTFSASTLLAHAVVGVGGAGRSLSMELLATTTYLLAAWACVVLQWSLAGVWATELLYWALLAALGWHYLQRGPWRHAPG